jgi:gamma-glutamyltranspeptidase/glutathione hydrolase
VHAAWSRWPRSARTLFLGAVVLAPLVTTLPARAVFAPSADGVRTAVATDNAEATEAALATLAAGGNAADAAVTAALALGVVNPVSSGLGGGGFALVYVEAEHKSTVLDFREVAPARVVVEELLARNQKKGDTAGKRGASVGVPGEPLGLEALVKRFGHRSLAEDAAPAVAIAERGFAVGHYLGETIATFADRISASPELSAGFLPGGVPAAYRTRMTRPELARTIRLFGAQGSGPFYEGPVGAKIVAAVQAAGGTMEASDLAAYRVKERAGLERTIGSRTIVTVPAPSAGGLMLLETLEMFGASPQSPLHSMGFGSSAYLHMLAEAMRGAVADRVRFAGDPDANADVGPAYDHALDPKQLAARRARIEPNRTHASPEFRTREHGTTHIIVADASGNVVTLTTTINAPFGAQIVAGDSGVLLNDELDDFSSPQDLAGFGVVGLGPNRPRPGVRPVSSITPAIVFEGGVPILAVGGSGGGHIATGVTQVTMARLVFGLDPSACVSAPRIHVTGASAELTVDGDIVEDVRTGLRARGESLKEEKYPHSAMQLVAWDRSGPHVRLLAASDPRKGGLAAAQ